MRSVKEGGTTWERTLGRYFAAVNVPLQWNALKKRFVGISGHEFARINPKARNGENVWVRMPEYIKRYEHSSGKQVVIFVTNRQYGDSVDDSLVVLRIGTFIPMLKALVDNDKERWTNESPND